MDVHFSILHVNYLSHLGHDLDVHFMLDVHFKFHRFQYVVETNYLQDIHTSTSYLFLSHVDFKYILLNEIRVCGNHGFFPTV